MEIFSFRIKQLPSDRSKKAKCCLRVREVRATEQKKLCVVCVLKARKYGGYREPSSLFYDWFLATISIALRPQTTPLSLLFLRPSFSLIFKIKNGKKKKKKKKKLIITPIATNKQVGKGPITKNEDIPSGID